MPPTRVFAYKAPAAEAYAIGLYQPYIIVFPTPLMTQLTMDDLAEWRKGGAAARRLTPDGYFGAPNPIDPELWRHFDETARIMAAALTKPR